MYVSRLKSVICRTGILHFHSTIASDHRPVYVDLFIGELFGNADPDIIKVVYKCFTTKNIKKCDKCIKHVYRMFGENHMHQKVQQEMKNQLAQTVSLTILARIGMS